MNHFMVALSACVAGLLAVPAAAPAQDDLKGKARQILEKYQDAILSVKIIGKQSMSVGGREAAAQDQKIEVNGVNVSPTGLVVVSHSATDPSARLKGMMGAFAGGGEEGPQFEMKTQVQDIKIVLNDGKEIAAEIVFSDKDLDIALVRPKEAKDLALPSVDLAPAPDPAVLDEFITISRMDRSTGRAPLVDVGRIRGVIRKPRTYYMAGGLGAGSPAFDPSGKLLGIFLSRPSAWKTAFSGGLMGMMGGGFDESTAAGLAPAILPTKDIQEAVKQYKESDKAK